MLFRSVIKPKAASRPLESANCSCGWRSWSGTAPTNEKKIAAAKATVKDLIHKYGVTLISVGNGTASRESEQIIVEILKEIPEKVAYVITNEAGASVYSASKLATEEFPNFDVGQRSAASIARRVQDPLAELVKIDRKSVV